MVYRCPQTISMMCGCFAPPGERAVRKLRARSFGDGGGHSTFEIRCALACGNARHVRHLPFLASQNTDTAGHRRNEGVFAEVARPNRGASAEVVVDRRMEGKSKMLSSNSILLNRLAAWAEEGGDIDIT